jgi:glutamate-1-semialdehyde aminotransferase
VPRIPYRGPLLVIGMVLGGAGLAAGTLAARHSMEKIPTPEAAAMKIRNDQAGTCSGYNVELDAAAAIQTRLSRHEEAARLLAMRQSCNPATPANYRSAR